MNSLSKIKDRLSIHEGASGVPVENHVCSIRMNAGLKIDPVSRGDFFDITIGIPGIYIRVKL
jgi:hypothetical protein